MEAAPDDATLPLGGDDATLPLGGDGAAITPGAAFGRFRVIGLLGAGGMGLVLRARDPELAREVAIKVLRADAGGSVAHRRLLAEAQAMAQVTHPNVVTVFDVGTAGDAVFIAMELVAGTTLRAWLDAAPRSWRDVVARFLAAGRGLEAIHRAGLVHRDFKPENVLIGADGRPRVADFGVAEDAAFELPGDAAVTASATADGRVIGTPRYMAPEQWRGEATDGRADQFAFGVALWTALHGAPPFPGVTVADIRASVLADRRTSRAPAAAAPAWLLAVVDRCLRIDRDARWPDLTAMLEAIERRLAGRRRASVALGLAAIAGVTAVGVVAVRGRGAPPDPCPAPRAEVDAAWGPARQAALRARLVGAAPHSGAAQFAAIDRRIAPYAAAWSTLRVAACRATRVAGTQSDAAMDARITCLDRRWRELTGTLDALAGAGDAVARERAVHALGALDRLDACDDPARAARETTLPDDPVARRRAEALVSQLEPLRLATRLHTLAPDDPRLVAAVAEARALAHAPTLAAALAIRINAEADASLPEVVVATARELIQVAARARDDEAEAVAWRMLINATADTGHPDDALAQEAAAAAAVLRAGAPTRLRVALLTVIASVLDVTPRSAEAVTRLREAEAILADANARAPGSPFAELAGDVQLELANALRRLNDEPGAAAALTEALARYRDVFGPDSLAEATVLHNQAEALRRLDRPAEARPLLEAALRINQARAPDSVAVAADLLSLAAVQVATDHAAEAVETYARAERIQVAAPSVSPNQLAGTRLGRGTALKRLGRRDEALAAYTAAIAAFTDGAGGANLGIAYYNRGEFHAHDKRWDLAIADYRAAITAMEAEAGPTSRRLAYPLLGLGRALVHLRRPADAVASLERGVALTADTRSALRGELLSWLAAALTADPHAAARSEALEREARALLADLAADGDPAAAAALAEHDKVFGIHAP